MSKAYQGYKNLQEMKMKEIEEYYLEHKEIIEPFLKLQHEFRKLGDQKTQSLMNQVDELYKNKKSHK